MHVKVAGLAEQVTSAAGGETPPTKDVAPVGGVSKNLY